MNRTLFYNLIYNNHPMEILVEDGLIKEMAPQAALSENQEAKRYDCGGYLLLPAFVDSHTHPDKTIMGMGYRHDYKETDLLSIIEAERALRGKTGLDTFTQASRYIERITALGTLFTRSHVDVDTENGLKGLEGVLEAREKYDDILTMQIVAFPQSGLVVRKGTYEILDEALKMGADVVGGLDPSSIDRDPKASIDAIFKLAEKHGKPVDIHLHEPGDLGGFALDLIADKTIALGMQGRVSVSHAFCLKHQKTAFIEKLGKAGIHIVTSAVSDITPPVGPLLSAGINVCAGNDNVQDFWSPYGTGDMLERACFVSMRNDFKTEDDMNTAIDLCTENGAKMMGLEHYGLSVGCNADFLLVKSDCITSAVSSIPESRIIVKGGKAILGV